MAKQKKQQPLTPERYIRERARLLPIYKCYKGETIGDSREMSIMVIRKHAGGTYTLAAFMLDRWCLGVKDAIWQFNIPEDEMLDFVDHFATHIEQWTEIEYVEAHNWVYGALDWATNAGISPCKDFALARYILEEDDDNVELQEYDFGYNGEYCLMAKSHKEADKYIPTLTKTLGVGNYKVILRPILDEEEKRYRRMGYYRDFPDMEYTYPGINYPKTLAPLHHPETEAIITKGTQDYTQADIDLLLSLPAGTLREDLHQLILHELGKQYGKNNEQLGEDKTNANWNTIGNSFMFLTKVGNMDDTLPVLLEYLRQNDDVVYFNEGDCGQILVKPLVYRFLMEDPLCFKSYLLEKGLGASAKNEILEYISEIACDEPSIRKPVLEMMHEVLSKYQVDLPCHTMCDGTVISFAIGVPIELNAVDFLPLIEDIYATGMVNESVEGSIEAVRERIMQPIRPDMHRIPYGDIPALVEKYKDFYRYCSQ